MNTPEFVPQPSSEPIDEEPEPRPISLERIDALLADIAQLWLRRDPANKATVVHLDMQLLAAYSELTQMCGDVTNRSTSAYLEQLHPAAHFELWFACNHLGKVIKLRHN